MSATKTQVRYADYLRAIGAGRRELSFNAIVPSAGRDSLGRPLPALATGCIRMKSHGFGELIGHRLLCQSPLPLGIGATFAKPALNALTLPMWFIAPVQFLVFEHRSKQTDSAGASVFRTVSTCVISCSLYTT